MKVSLRVIVKFNSESMVKATKVRKHKRGTAALVNRKPHRSIASLRRFSLEKKEAKGNGCGKVTDPYPMQQPLVWEESISSSENEESVNNQDDCNEDIDHELDGEDSDSDYEPAVDDQDDDEEIDSSSNGSVCQILESKIITMFDDLKLCAHLERTLEYSITRANTASARTRKYLAFAMSRAMVITDGNNLKKKTLRSTLYKKDIYLYEYCDVLVATKSLKPGSVVNILLDILLVCKWLHFYAKIKYSKNCTTEWFRFVNTLQACKALWHKKGKRYRRENTKTLEEMVSEGKLPPNGLLDIQEMVTRHLPLVTEKVHSWIEAKVNQ